MASQPAIRLVLQRVNSASLLTDNVAARVAIGRGIIVHVAFFAGAQAAHVEKAVRVITESRLYSFEGATPPTTRSEDAGAGASAAGAPSPPSAAAPAATRAKPVALVDDASLSVMLVPQASIAGRLKGRVAQYHSQCERDVTAELYCALVGGLRAALLPRELLPLLDANGRLSAAAAAAASGSDAERAPRVVASGTFGATQALLVDSPGPMTHVLDVDCD